jgi:hypothetical protein
MSASPQEPSPVRIVDVDMPFGSMVTFMVKWALAAIPALIILFVIAVILSAMVAGFFGALFHK